MELAGIEEDPPHAGRKPRVGEKFRQIVDEGRAAERCDPCKLALLRLLEEHAVHGQADAGLVVKPVAGEEVAGSRVQIVLLARYGNRVRWLTIAVGVAAARQRAKNSATPGNISASDIRGP